MYQISYILMGLFAIIHALWGEKFLLPDLHLKNVSEEIVAVFRITWHQISFVLASGAVYLALRRTGLEISGEQLIFIVVSGNFIVYILLSILLKQVLLLIKSVPLIIFVIVLLCFLGNIAF